MIFEQKFLLRMQDMGDGQSMTNRSYLELLTDTANMHGKSIGQYSGIREQIHLCWVVLAWRLKVTSRPPVCETVTVNTWSQNYNRALAYRDYEVLDERGLSCAKATSSWMLIDLNRHFPARLTDELMARYQSEPDRANFPGYVFPRPNAISLAPQKTLTLPILKSMIDCNGHVHNTAYLDMADEIMPDGLSVNLMNDIEVCYVHELKRGATALVEYAHDGDKHHVFIRDAADGSLHALIMMW